MGGQADKAISRAGWHRLARRSRSPNFDARPDGMAVELIVVHNISLPPGQFFGDAVEQFFRNQLQPITHPFFASIAALRVSAHFFIRRSGELVQFVSTENRAWHAGASDWNGRTRCNDFSVGVELEGSDASPFTTGQYRCLSALTKTLVLRYPSIKAVAGHADIAPGRKTDPGPRFDWSRYLVETGLPQGFRNARVLSTAKRVSG
jgi:N-acetyl-anhydromuramoyl-L-alanine amidase